MDNNNVIFENYEAFLTENKDDLNSPQDIVKLIPNESMFRSYTDAITESLDANTRSSVMNVLNAQRNMLLTEAANVPASSFASGWVCMS